MLYSTRRRTYPFSASDFIAMKFGVPSPVTGSQPSVAFQLAYGMMPAPLIFSPLCKSTPAHPKDPPSVMSVIALLAAALLYSQGLMKPMLGFPARKRASFKRAMMEATTGEAAEVPPLGWAVPFITVR